MTPDRKLEWDWFPGRVPENVALDETAYLETTYSFELFRSREPEALRIGRGASIYLGVMFDLGPTAHVRVGDYTLMNGSRLICDAAIEIGDHCLISWNTVFMDTYRVPAEPALRPDRTWKPQAIAPLGPFVPMCQPALSGSGTMFGLVSIPASCRVSLLPMERSWAPALSWSKMCRRALSLRVIQLALFDSLNLAPAPLCPIQRFNALNESNAFSMPSAPKGKIIVFGILFYYPLAGVTYQFLHYLLGLRRLGYDPYYVEDSARWIYDPRLNDMSPNAVPNIEMVLPALQAHGLADRWCFRGYYEGGGCHGLSESQLLQLYRDADGFLNVTGAQEIRDEHRAIRRRLYVESDPFVAQVKVAKGDKGMIDLLAAHDMHFSFGENLGAPDCPVPIERFHWLPTRQPVAMELWKNTPPCGGATWNTITTWHNKGKDIEWRGDMYYWTKDREFRQFLDLPRLRSAQQFEMAATVGDDVKALLKEHGWQQADSVELSRNANRYRDYISQSRGEFTVARDQYVRPRTGWFSDRTACYLAAGRPVITQETGFGKFLPNGRGLFGFTTKDDILAAIDAVESDYEGHCRAARDVAREYLDADKVVGTLMQRAGL